MKTIGLIGGMSWESTVTYYKIINETVKERLGGFHSGKILLYSVDFAEIEECQAKGDWEKSAEILSEAAENLEKAGADFIVICTNTMHKVAGKIQENIKIPVIHIADATAHKLKQDGILKTALLGTKYTMTQDFYKEKLRENGIDDNYPYGYGIRLDSGDLAYLSAEVRKILDDHGLLKCKIFATNSLDEYLISDLERQGAKIDSYGVGDAIATSKSAPCFGNVYKLVQIDGEPVLKKSEDRVKLINPGFQITYRLMKHDPEFGDVFKADVTCLRGDALSLDIEHGKSFTIKDEYDRYKFKTFDEGTYQWRTLQIPVIENGKRCAPVRTLMEKKAFYEETLHHFSPSERRLINPHYYKVDISDELYNLKNEILTKLVQEINNFKID